MYLNEVRPGDVWITNCLAEDLFVTLVEMQAKFPDWDVWADVPQDMHEYYSQRNWSDKLGAGQAQLIRWNYYGIYRRAIKD